jgi:putative redox protein
VIQGEQRQIEREVRVGGALDEAQRARLLEIAARTPVTRLLEEGSPISTVLTVE